MSYTVKPSTDFINNIEEAIKEFGVITCPNPSCTKRLTSKKKMDTDNNAYLEYGCEDPSCFYHKKRKVFIPLEEIALGDKLNSQLKNISYSKILYSTLFALFCIASYTSYHLYSINQFIENDVADTEINISSELSANTPDILPSKTIDDNKISLTELVTQTKTLVASGSFDEAKMNFEKILNEKKYREALVNNKDLRYELLEMIGDSYDKSKPQFSYHFLEDRNSFKFLGNFINTFDTEKNMANVYLGKAYLNFPNILKEKIGSDERKKMQLIALNYYLNAAKKDQLGKYHKSSIKEVNEICKTYRLYSYSPKKLIPTEKIILQKQKNVIQYRIDFVEKIIKNIS